jgi:hypothetical protein
VSLKDRDELFKQIPAMATAEQVMAIAKAAMYACATGREGPLPPANTASWE